MDWIVKGDREELASAFGRAGRVAGGHGADATKNVRFVLDKERDRSYVEGTNNTMAVRTHIAADTEEEKIDELISPKIAPAIKAMRPGEVTITREKSSDTTGGLIRITGSGKGVYEVGVGSGTWPNVRSGEDEIDWEDVPPAPADEVLGRLRKAVRFASVNESHPHLQGVNLRMLDDGVLVTEATDSHRMYQHRSSYKGSWPMKGETATIPLAMIDHLVALFSSDVKLAADDSLFYASDGTTFFSCRRVGGKYPPLDTLIPKAEDSKMQLTLPRQEVSEAIDRVKGVAEGGTIVTFEIEEDGMLSFVKLQVKYGGHEAVEYVGLPNGQEYDDYRTGFALKNLESVIDTVTGDEVTLRLHENPLKPTVVECGETIMVMMPTRV